MMEWWSDGTRCPVFCTPILQYSIIPFRQFFLFSYAIERSLILIKEE